MSFSVEKEVIDIGDLAILYINATNMHAIKVVPTITNKHGETIENVFQTTYGALKVAALVGHKYGTRINLSRGWAFVLQPTPELWTLTLPHRTQIIYTPDISMIVFRLEIRPGSFVVESGTGSGSLTHALARRVSPNGVVRTFDFHDQRVQVASKEFDEHGLSSIVQVACRDVCKEGFGVDVQGKADAVFLDLPHPWEVIDHVVAAMKSSGGRFCSFSPCIEQVQRTCTGLRQSGFLEINTVECLQREILVNNKIFPCVSVESDNSTDDKVNILCTNYNVSMPGHTGYLTFATMPPIWGRQASVDEASPEDEISNEQNT